MHSQILLLVELYCILRMYLAFFYLAAWVTGEENALSLRRITRKVFFYGTENKYSR